MTVDIRLLGEEGMNTIPRSIETIIEKWLFEGKVITIFGARQVGKTTLVKRLLEKHGDPKHYYDGDLLSVQEVFRSQAPETYRRMFGAARMIVLDEAQQVPDIGRSLKIIHDTLPGVQVLATGSSSFELGNRTSEPLTGRGLSFTLYPFSLRELEHRHTPFEVHAALPFHLRFGLYPEIVDKSEEDARVLLDDLVSKYLYKDVLAFEQLKKPDLLLRLLKLLALQLGSEVSLNELATTLGVGRATVERYLDLLEKCFVIFRLKAFSRNLRTELTRKEKIYFYDVGVRNGLISRFQPLDVRDDIGALWENACIVERMKLLAGHGLRRDHYFWRTHDQKEIDLIEEHDGRLDGYEFKWSEREARPPALFLKTYRNASVAVVHRENWRDFLVVTPQ